MSSPTPRPVFLYGTLCAQPLLAWALTGDASNTSAVSQLIRPARVHGYSRVSLRGRDYPAAIKHEPHSLVDGYLLMLETTSQRKKLDNFEGKAFKPVSVAVTIFDSENKPQEKTVEADISIWAGEESALTTDPWELEVFEKERLEAWLDLFQGVKLVGESED
ncbi:AIG2-like protein [Durotheca rogersii]|uniref:AIG2-like protein n=1 Tax=Durotheca rogersii TaxID=419775 RepID=UPI00221E5D3D|nr:AIG2-like protein [Durotheca rogersii]KAI5868218.1 AIG2-like protein [Durotheca rogersii]